MKQLVPNDLDAASLSIASMKSRRHLLLCITAITAYFAPVLGANNNLIFLSLSICAVAVTWPAITAVRKLRWLALALMAALALGISFNGYVAALRSATPYLGLLVAFALLSQPRAETRQRLSNGILLLYGAGAIQLTLYLLQVVLSPYYLFLYSLDEFHRFSIGWISVACFFHASLPTRKKIGLPRSLRRFGSIFWMVPILAALNSSRSELLIVALLMGISFYLRRPFMFIMMIIAATVVLPAFIDQVPVFERINRSIEEVFLGSLNNVVDVHANYRAFENLMMVERVLASGVTGCGFGCSVPLPFAMTLDEQEYDAIAVFHNGILTVVLHFGLLGVLIILSLLFQLWKTWRSLKATYRQRSEVAAVKVHSNALRFTVMLILLGTSLTTGGFMSSQDVLVLLLPLSCAVGISKKSHSS